MPGTCVDGDLIAGSTRSLRNNPSSPKQNFAAWRLSESHLRGIRTPTGPHSSALSSHKATMSQSEKYVIAGSIRSLRNNPSSPKQNFAAWRLSESHLRGIRSPTESHGSASSSHKATMSQSEKYVIAGSIRSLRNNPSSPKQNLVAWRLSENHLRGIRTPTEPA